MIIRNKTFFFVFLFLFNFSLSAQFGPTFSEGIDDDSLSIEGDIFSDFNEDLESSQVLDDERFYRYGRFYSFNTSVGFTSFTGTRGEYYINQNPSLAFSLVYFLDFTVAFGLGIGYSKHALIFDTLTNGSRQAPLGKVEVNLFRSFFFYRYYIDTSNLNTAITYSNPYIVGVVEYWNKTNKFLNQPTIRNNSEGQIGFAAGGGLEFPIELKKSYVGVEFLYHWVNFKDSDEPKFQPIPGDENSSGVENLQGGPITLFISFVINW